MAIEFKSLIIKCDYKRLRFIIEIVVRLV
jgi:hypothetical protein